MTITNARLVDADGVDITPEPETGSWFSIPDIPASVFVDLARMGVQMGIGAVALAYENGYRLAFEAIDRGSQIEKDAIDRFSKFEREQVTYMKDYINRVRVKSDRVDGGSIEVHVEEALKTHDVPTRDDIRELKHQIAELNETVAKLTR